MVAYQAQLDRVKSLAVPPEPNPVLGTQSSWDRTDLAWASRAPRSTTPRTFAASCTSTHDADPRSRRQSPEDETIMRLGPDLPAQLKRKIDLMNAHWLDYDRLFTKPNP